MKALEAFRLDVDYARGRIDVRHWFRSCAQIGASVKARSVPSQQHWSSWGVDDCGVSLLSNESDSLLHATCADGQLGYADWLGS